MGPRGGGGFQVTLPHLVPTVLGWAREYQGNATQSGRGGSKLFSSVERDTSW